MKASRCWSWVVPMGCTLAAAIGWRVWTGGTGAAFAQAPPRTIARFHPEQRSDAERLLRSAGGLAENGQWAEAIGLYQQVIQRFGDSVAPVSPHDPVADPEGISVLYIDARQNCHRRIAALPPEARALYRRQVDPQAERWLREGIARGDRVLLRRVVDEAFCSSFGDDALEALGDLAFREGRFVEALGFYGQLVPDAAAPAGSLVHPDPSVSLAVVAAKKLLARAALGVPLVLADELDAFAVQFPRAEGAFAGRTGPLRESLAEALERHHFAPGPIRDGGWTTFAGAPSRTKVAATAIDVGSLQWRVRLKPVGPRVGPTIYSNRFQPQVPSRPDRGLAYFPIVIGERVVLCDADRLFAYNLGDRPAAGSAVEPEVAWEQTPRSPSPGTAIQAALPRFTVTAYGDRVFARLGTPRIGPSYLVAVRNSREFEGNLLWSVPATQPALPRRAGAGVVPGRSAAFEGTPVADERNVYVGLTEPGAAGQMTALYVVCLDAETGATRWVRPLGEAPTFPEPGMGFAPSMEEVGNRLLTLDGGTLYYQTNLGVVAALDAETGAVRWLATYPHVTQSRYGVGRDLNPAIVHNGLVIVAPDDAAEIFAFDAVTGQLVWHRNIRDGIASSTEITHLLGVAKGRLIATGNRVYAFDAKTGKLLSYWPEAGTGYPGFGRGLLAGDYIYWPTKTGILVLDQATGRRAERETIALQEVFGTTGGNLAVGDGYLVVATEESLVVFCENSRLIDRYKELIAAAPNEASHYVRLARVAEATGQEELALESLAGALKVARSAEILDGQPLVELAAAQRHRLLLRLAARAAAASDWTTASERYTAAATEARNDRDRLAARLLLAEALDRSGNPRGAVALLQESLTDERLRGLSLPADDRRTVRADLLIADRLAGLLKAHGRELYQDYEATARKLLAQGAAQEDPRLFEEIGRSYPAASVVPEALLALGAYHEAHGQPAEAARAYRKLLATAADKTTRARALLGLGRALEAQEFWVPARDAYARAEARFGEIRLDATERTVAGLVADRLARPPFDRMTGDRSEPALPLPLARRWEVHWPSPVRPLTAEGVPPSAGAGRIFLADGPILRPLDPATGLEGWSAELDQEPVWAAYLNDLVLAATPNRLVALDLKSGAERWRLAAGDPAPARRAVNPFARAAVAAPSDLAARLEGFKLVGGRVFFRRGDRELVALDGESGQIDWSFAPGGKASLNPRMAIGPRQVILQVRGPNGIVVLETRTGIPRAEFAQAEQEEAWARDPLPIDDEHVAVVTDPRTVVSLDLTKGVAAWTYREPSALPKSGPPRLLGDSGRLLVLRDGSELVRLDPATGRKNLVPDHRAGRPQRMA